MKQKYFLNNINELKINLKKSFLIFLEWDLWAGKTTFSKYLINNILKVKEDVTSPTYIYYNKYVGEFEWKKIDIIHFDLYRIKNYSEFFAIGWEDIFDNNNGIIIVEWPKIIKKYYKCDLEIFFKKTNIEWEREVEIITF